MSKTNNSTSTRRNREYTFSKETILYLEALRRINEAYDAIYAATDAAFADVDSVMNEKILPQYIALQNATRDLLGDRIIDSLAKSKPTGKAAIEI